MANNLSEIEMYRIKKKVEKIFNFWKTKMTEMFDWMCYDYFYREAGIVVASNFTLPENRNKDFRNYPWDEKILEMRKIMFGF